MSHHIAVILPRALRSFCDSPDEVRLSAKNLREAFAELARLYPQVHVRLCDERGDPRPHLGVFVNDDHMRVLAGLDTVLKPGDVVTILPAVSGG